jgi:hypothetical protein
MNWLRVSMVMPSASAGQMNAVMPPLVVSVLGRGGAGGHARRVRADVRLGEQERRDVRVGHLGEPLALLLLGAEHAQRLGQADRLMGREQGRQRRVRLARERQGLVVVDLRQAEAAVLLGDLHAEGAELLEPLDDVLGDLRVALDLERIDPLLEEGAHPDQEGVALGRQLGGGLGLGVDDLRLEVAEEQLLAEAGLLPLGLAAGLSHLL